MKHFVILNLLDLGFIFIFFCEHLWKSTFGEYFDLNTLKSNLRVKRELEVLHLIEFILNPSLYLMLFLVSFEFGIHLNPWVIKFIVGKVVNQWDCIILWILWMFIYFPFYSPCLCWLCWSINLPWSSKFASNELAN